MARDSNLYVFPEQPGMQKAYAQNIKNIVENSDGVTYIDRKRLEHLLECEQNIFEINVKVDAITQKMIEIEKIIIEIEPIFIKKIFS